MAKVVAPCVPGEWSWECFVESVLGPLNTPIATPPAPPQELWTKPPASGEEADATVSALINQQLREQQDINAGTVHSTWQDIIYGKTSQIGEGVTSLATSPTMIAVLLAVGLIGIVMLGDSGPRRYGR